MGERFARAEFSGLICVDPATLRETLLAMIAGEQTALVVYESDGVARGAMGAMTYRHPLSGETTAIETFWWMDPESRGPASVRLLRHVEDWARGRGAVKMQMGSPAGRNMTDFYDRLGYAEVERSYQRTL